MGVKLMVSSRTTLQRWRPRGPGLGLEDPRGQMTRSSSLILALIPSPWPRKLSLASSLSVKLFWQQCSGTVIISDDHLLLRLSNRHFAYTLHTLCTQSYPERTAIDLQIYLSARKSFAFETRSLACP